MKTILVDMDGVIADFEKRFLQLWREKYPKRFSLELNERKHFHIWEDYPAEFSQEIERIYREKNFFATLPEIPGALVGLNKLVELGHQVFICTSPLRSGRYCIPEKVAWVEQNLGGDWLDRLFITRRKELVVGDVLIDDRPEFTNQLVHPSWEHVLYTQPYNEHIKSKRRMTWEGILDGSFEL